MSNRPLGPLPVHDARHPCACPPARPGARTGPRPAGCRQGRIGSGKLRRPVKPARPVRRCRAFPPRHARQPQVRFSVKRSPHEGLRRSRLHRAGPGPGRHGHRFGTARLGWKQRHPGSRQLVPAGRLRRRGRDAGERAGYVELRGFHAHARVDRTALRRRNGFVSGPYRASRAYNLNSPARARTSPPSPTSFRAKGSPSNNWQLTSEYLDRTANPRWEPP